tara:strand:+ start:17455 stop:18156 length:702 start_codon:yes stop_codon:yes gene_type:complete
MLLKGEGIVLKSIKYGEKSQICSVFTKEYGVLSVIHNRIINKKRRDPNYFQALSHIEFICYPSKNSELHRIKEVQFKVASNSIEASVVKNALKFFLAEVLEKIIREKEQNNALFLFIAERVTELNSTKESLGSFHLEFMIGLLNHLGIIPQIAPNDHYFDLIEGISTDTKPLRNKFISGKTFEQFQKIFENQRDLGKLERNNVLNILLEYIDIQLNTSLNQLKTKAVLEVIFE